MYLCGQISGFSKEMEQMFFKFIKFGAVGLSGVFVDFGFTWLFKERLGANKYVANSIGFLMAVVSNYVLNRIWTFNDHNPDVLGQFVRFLMIATVGLLLNNGIIYFLTEKKEKANFYVAKFIATGIVMIWNFGANVLFTFA